MMWRNDIKMKHLVSPIGSICKVGGLYYLKAPYTYDYKIITDILSVTAIYDNEDNVIGCLGVSKTVHVFNEKFNFNCYFIPILQPTEYCIEDALAYPWWSLEEEKIK